MFLLRVFRLALLCLGLFGSSVAWTQPAGAKGDDFLYRVMAGDTLGELAQKYTLNRSNWSALQRLNNVQDQFRLPIAMLLRIPFSMIPVRDSTARVVHMAGTASSDAGSLYVGAQIAQGHSIQTGSNGFVTLQLSDGSIVSIPPSSQVTIERLQEFVGTGLIDSIIHMNDGSVESQVAPGDTGVGRFEVRTPVSVTGVRGTRLRVHAGAEGSRSEVVSGMAGVDGSTAPEVILRPQQGVAVDTTGRSLGVRRLLAAPQLSEPSRGPGGWVATFDPVPGAAAYLVSVAKDPEGGQLVYREKVQAPPISFHASAPGTHYVFVRALDELGVGGLDSRQSFEGAFVLMDGVGSMIMSGSGMPILVADY